MRKRDASLWQIVKLLCLTLLHGGQTSTKRKVDMISFINICVHYAIRSIVILLLFFNRREPTPVHGRDPLHHLHLGHSLGQSTTGSCLSQPPDSPASSRSAARSPPNLEFTDEQLEADLHHLPSDTNSCDLNRKLISIGVHSDSLEKWKTYRFI